MERYFGKSGLLERKVSGFEYRPSQLEMAQSVADCLRGETPLLVEAGTGTGKTWAYLIPAIESGKKVVISTGTKTLQDQIFDHDIPLLKRLFFPQLHAVCIKGRRNYLCRRRFKDFSYQPTFWNRDEIKLFQRLQNWAARTKVGDRAEISWLPDNFQTWSAISSGSEQCLGQQCAEHPNCFLTRVRQESFRAGLLIVNHHLFFADLALRMKGLGEVIPEYEAVIFDEAHQLEDVMGQYFGLEFSNVKVLDLIREIQTECAKNLKVAVKVRDVLNACHLLEGLSRQVTHAFAHIGPGNGRFRMDTKVAEGLQETADQMIHAFEQLGAILAPHGEERPVLESCRIRSLELASSLRALLDQDDESLIYWYELTQQGIFLHGTPVELAPIVRQQLASRTTSLVFTSATISTAGSFGFFRERLGIPEESREVLFPSPFDIEEQALLYIPMQFPAPQEPSFCASVAEETLKILEKSRGRALFLFTSYRHMHQVHDYLQNRLPYPILMQGHKPKRVLLGEFKDRIDSVLLATSSFWQGVDVPGEALSCVLIDKLPFEVPDDPLIAARTELLARQGKNPFYHYQIPRAIIHLKQGVGRLLRSSSDRGAVVIFDVRLFTKSYGRFFLQSLPPYRLARNIAEIDRFFAVSQARVPG